MDEYLRHKKVYKYVTPVGRALLNFCYGLEFEPIELGGPSILICNHVTNIDPIYLACCLKNSHTYFVASEHLSRMGRITKIIQYMAGFIPQKKGNSAMSTVKACIRHIKDGHSVAIFAEGNTNWDGVSDHIVSSTGKLVKMARVPLVTFRLEGAYLSTPRWRGGIRRGRMKIAPVRVYSPEELKNMTYEEINEAIDRDIYTNIWTNQAENPVAYSGGKRAKGMDRALFICPKCGKIGTLHTKGNIIACQCGFEREIDKYGFYTKKEPFANLYEWDVWQKEELKKIALEAESDDTETILFSDDQVSLRQIKSDHEMEILETGTIRQFVNQIVVGAHTFPIEKLEGIAIVNTRRLLFTCDRVYYEVRGKVDTCMRKYYLYNKYRNEIKLES